MLSPTPAQTALNWLIASDLAFPLSNKIREAHDRNMAIAHSKTRNQARHIIKEALREMPAFLGSLTPTDLESLIHELLPDHE